jgi:hypothetical protein
MGRKQDNSQVKVAFMNKFVQIWITVSSGTLVVLDYPVYYVCWFLGHTHVGV